MASLYRISTLPQPAACDRMFALVIRQQWGSVVCPSCGTLVGVRDERCLTCGRWNPGMWGFAPVLTRLGRDFGFTPVVIGTCVILYLATLVADPSAITAGSLSLFGFLSPSIDSLWLFGASGFQPVLVDGRWWTLLTAGWLHGGILHILFNMMFLRNLAPPVGEFY